MIDSATHLSESDGRDRRTLLRLALRLLVVLALVYGAYLVLANLLLATDLGEVVNRHPERRRVSWSSGWSWVPGRFSVAGFRFEQHTPHGDLEVELDELTGRFELGALFERRLQIVDLRGRGFSFDWRGSTRPDDVRPPDGVAPSGSTEGVVRRRALSVELDDVVIEGLDHVLIQGLPRLGPSPATGTPSGLAGYRLEGEGGLKGNLVVDRDGRLWLDTTLRLTAGQLFDVEQHQATVSDFSTHLAISGWQPRTERGVEALPRVSGSFDLQASSADLGLLGPFLGGGRGVAIEGRGDRLEVVLRLVAGRLTPGSRLLAASRDGEVAFLDYRARGATTIEGRVRDDGSGIELDCTLEDYALQRTGLSQPHLHGTGFSVRAEYPSTLLHASVLDRSAVRVKWPRAQLPDLTLYNSFLPAQHGARILSGHGTVEADFRLASGGSEGWAKLEAQGVRLSLDPLELTGDLAIETRFNDLDWSKGEVPVGGSRVELRGVSVIDRSDNRRRSRDWWAKLQVVEGTLGRDLSFRGDLDARIRDTGPLVALFLRRRLPGFVENALRIDVVQARLLLTSNRRAVAFDDLRVDGQGLEVLGRFRLAEHRSGLLYLRYRRVALAAEVDGDEVDLQLLHPKRWFDERWAAEPGSGNP